MKLYKINDWRNTYETHDTRKLSVLRWIPVPNKHDGLTFRQVASERDAPVLFAGWILLVQLASRASKERRGQLVRGNTPMQARDMALVTGFPVAMFERALVYFSQPHVGWLIAENFETELPLLPPDAGDAGTYAGEKTGASPENIPANGMEWKGKEGKGISGAKPAKPARARDVLFDALAIAEGSDPKQLTKSAAARIATALAQIREASPDVMPSDIQARAARYRKVMPQGSTLTANALAAHWARCGQALAAFAPEKPKDGPDGWRDTLRRLYPENTHEGTFATLPESIRKEIEATY